MIFYWCFRLRLFTSSEAFDIDFAKWILERHFVKFDSALLIGQLYMLQNKPITCLAIYILHFYILSILLRKLY